MVYVPEVKKSLYYTRSRMKIWGTVGSPTTNSWLDELAS